MPLDNQTALPIYPQDSQTLTESPSLYSRALPSGLTVDSFLICAIALLLDSYLDRFASLCEPLFPIIWRKGPEMKTSDPGPDPEPDH